MALLFLPESVSVVIIVSGSDDIGENLSAQQVLHCGA